MHHGPVTELDAVWEKSSQDSCAYISRVIIAIALKSKGFMLSGVQHLINIVSISRRLRF